jgi:GntR family transcriptional regulator
MNVNSSTSMKNRIETAPFENSTNPSDPDSRNSEKADGQQDTHFLTRSHIPLYYQLEQILREQISSGAISLDHPLPTENELCKKYGVSRTTVRQAIAPLMREGLIDRIPGKGSYLIHGKSKVTTLHYSKTIEGLVPLQEALEKPKIHYKGWISPSKKIASLFDLRSGGKAYCMRGVHLIKGGNPLNYFNITIPPKYAHLFEGRKETKRVFLTILENTSGMKVHKVQQTVKASKALGNLAKFLDLPNGEPVLEFERIWYASETEAFMVAVSFYRSDNFHLFMEFTQQG